MLFHAPPMRMTRMRPLENDWVSLLLLALLIFFTIALMVFIFFLPFWSWLLNDYLGMGATLCTTDPTTIVCGNGVDYVQMATELGRFKPNGELWACGCGEGFFADWACPLGSVFSISGFISTAPGTGTMAALSSWPIAAMWIYGAGGIPHNTVAIRLSLFAFHFFYGLFLVNTTCIFPVTHKTVVILFIAAQAVHYIVVAVCMGGCETMASRLIWVAAITGVGALLGGSYLSAGTLAPFMEGWWRYHIFWFGECVGLSCAFLIAPVLLLFQKDEDKDDIDERAIMLPTLA